MSAVVKWGPPQRQTSFPTRDITKLVVVVHPSYPIHLLDMPRPRPLKTSGNIAGAVQAACKNLPHLSELSLLFGNIGDSISLDMHENRKMLSTLITSSMCVAEKLQKLHLKFNEYMDPRTKYEQLSTYEGWQTLTFDIEAMPLQSKSTILQPLLACTFARLRRELGLESSQPFELFTHIISNYSQADHKFLAWSEKVLLGPPELPRHYSAIEKIRRNGIYSISERNIAERTVVGWKEDSSPIWGDWRQMEEKTVWCVGAWPDGEGEDFDALVDKAAKEIVQQIIGVSV